MSGDCTRAGQQLSVFIVLQKIEQAWRSRDRQPNEAAGGSTSSEFYLRKTTVEVNSRISDNAMELEVNSVRATSR